MQAVITICWQVSFCPFTKGMQPLSALKNQECVISVPATYALVDGQQGSKPLNNLVLQLSPTLKTFQRLVV